MSGSVTAGDDYAGGLIGVVGSDATISYSSAAGSVTGGDDYAGGLVGSNEGVIAASYSNAAVSGSDYIGGLAGGTELGGILASYATGSVNGSGNYIGGLVGLNGGDITASYSTGAVPGSDTTIGGMVGDDDGVGTITASYWDTESSGQATSDGGTGKTSAELRAPTGYTGIYSAWNLDLDNADDDDSHSTGQDNPWDFGATTTTRRSGTPPASRRGRARWGP